MPTYRYQCADCGGFELVRSMSEAADPTPCPGCREPARRVFGLRTTGFVETGLRAAMDASARSADAPSVVTSVPGRARRATRITTDPRHRRLPRP
ncbi:MAG: zinc ribbon domain-containing protein [Mycobacterium sp.]